MVSKDTPIAHNVTDEDGASTFFCEVGFLFTKHDLTMSVFIRLLIMITIVIRVVVKVFKTFIDVCLRSVVVCTHSSTNCFQFNHVPLFW